MNKEFMNEFMEEIEDAEVLDLGINLEDSDFKVLNKGQADFFLRKIKELQEEIDETNEFCDGQIKSYSEKINNHRDKKTSSAQNTIDYFTGLLQQFADKELEDNPKKKSIKLPFGTLSYKKQQDKLLITDEEQLIQVLTANNLPGVKVVEKVSIDKKLIKGTIETKEDGYYIDGIKMPGVSVEVGQNTFGVKLVKE